MLLNLYVANLAEYVKGNLVGEWLELPLEEEELTEALNRISKNGQDELAIHDYEADFNIKEYDSITLLNELAWRVHDLEDWEGIALIAGIDYFGNSNIAYFQEALDAIEAGNFTYWCDIQDYSDLGLAVVDAGFYGEVPQDLIDYIDYEAIGKDYDSNSYGGVFLENHYCYIEFHNHS